MKKYIPVIILIFFTVTLRAGNPVSVPYDHPVYEFLDRMETLGLLNDVLDGKRPMARYRVAELLSKIDRNAPNLTAIDRRFLADYLLDFRYELQAGSKHSKNDGPEKWYSVLSSVQNFKNDFNDFFRQQHPQEENHVFMWEDSLQNFYFDYIHNLSYESRSEGEYRLANWQTYRFRGLMGGDFGIALDVSLIGLHGDSLYASEHPVLKNSFSQQNEEDPRFADRTGGELAWHTSMMDVRFAQQTVQWGPGESGKLALSDNVQTFPYLELSKNWGWGQFTFMMGKLLSVPSADSVLGQPIYPDKWIAAHRLEFSPWDPLTIGLNEMFIYGNRYADWAYLLPFNFYRSVQHNLRDRDNATISVDLEYIPWSGTKFYGAVFLDEFKQSELGSDWYGNKQAFQIGWRQEDPIGLQNTAFTLEYVAVMPWVYTHKFGINHYTHDARGLGYWAGPNSEVIYGHIRKDWHQRLRSGVIFRQSKHGANYPDENIGGDILVGHSTLLGTQSTPRETRRFLEGVLTTEKLFEAYVRYEMFNDLFLNIRWRDRTQKTQDASKHFTEFEFALKLDY